jgi:hypothetical protein
VGNIVDLAVDVWHTLVVDEWNAKLTPGVDSGAADHVRTIHGRLQVFAKAVLRRCLGTILAYVHAVRVAGAVAACVCTCAQVLMGRYRL